MSENLNQNILLPPNSGEVPGMNPTDVPGNNNNDGSGFVRIREIGASWLHSFDGDFGKFIHHEFKVETPNNINDESFQNWKIHPNPTRNQCNIEGVITELTTILPSAL